MVPGSLTCWRDARSADGTEGFSQYIEHRGDRTLLTAPIYGRSFQVSLKNNNMHCSMFRVVREHHQLTATYDASAITHPGPLLNWVLKQINEGLVGHGEPSTVSTDANYVK